MLEQAFLGEHDFYDVMELEPAATQYEVDEAFKILSGNLNLRDPDLQARMHAAEKMLALTQAYEALSDPMLRARYDVQLLGRRNFPVKDQVELLFKEGIRAWRKQETDLALRYFKEVIQLYPHRPLYRVHLAIAYAEKDWISFTESELETALRLDPDYAFAKETVAKLLFKMPDRDTKWKANPLNRKVALMASCFVACGVLLASGLPQQFVGGIFAKIGDSTKINPKDAAPGSEALPPDMVQELAQRQQQQIPADQPITIPFFEGDYRPEGKVFNYGHLEAQEKVYYPDQKVVVVTYKDGSILTYRPQELKGWKKDSSGQAIMITANNELVPSPATLPLKLPGNAEAKLDEPGFPAWLFPEYGVSSTDSGASSDPAAPSSENPTPQNPGAQNSVEQNPTGVAPSPLATVSPTTAPVVPPPVQEPYDPFGARR